jgi:hypothetical protein
MLDQTRTDTLTAAPLTVGGPSMGSSEIEALTPVNARQRRHRARSDAGDMVLQDLVLDEDLRDEMARQNWFVGFDASNPQEVAQAILKALREDLLCHA